ADFLHLPAPLGAHERGVDRARALARAAVRLVLEAEASAVEPGATRVFGAFPLPEERRLVARVPERFRFPLEVPERVLRVAEIQARQPRPLLTDAGIEVEQAVLERELEARRRAAARAHHEIHR